MTFLDRGRTAVVAMPPPPGADPSSTPPAPRGISGSLTMSGGAIEGRLSLSLLAALIVASILFYYWTRTAQGGG